MKDPTESRLPPQTEEIIHSLRASLPELRRLYSITYFGLSGSFARGEQKRRSDLDLLVEKQTLKPAIGRHILQEVIPV